MKHSERIAVAERVFESNLTDLMQRPNVVGAGIGYRERGGKETDEVVVQVLVERKVPPEELSPKELLPAELAVEEHDEPVGIDVVEVGRIELATSAPSAPTFPTGPDTARYRPLQGGVSVSRTSINSRTGTLGGWAVDTTDNKVVGISARHVLGGPTSSRVLQPAKAFGGSSTDNEIGRVKRQVEESPDRTLRADAAITSIESGFNPFCGVAPAILEIVEWKQLDKVEKQGCMTRLTSGASIISPRPVEIIRPSRDPNGAEHPPVRNTFRMSYTVPASGKRFAIEGDSGSLVFRLAPGKVTGTHPVLGVVVAISETTTSIGAIVQSIYASPISEVFSALKLTTLNGTKMTMKDTGWTSGWTNFLPYRTFTGNTRYLGYKAATGQVTLDQIRSGGTGVDTIGSTTWAAGWTSLMPFRVPGGQGCMAYNAVNGAIEFNRILLEDVGAETGIQRTGVGLTAPTYTSLVPFTMPDGNQGFIGYSAVTGAYSINRIEPDGSGLEPIGSPGWWTLGWTGLIPFSYSGGQAIIFYQASTGTASFDRIRPDGSGTDHIASATWTTGWTHFAPYQVAGKSYYLGYKAATGEITIDRVRSNGATVDTLHAQTVQAGWTSWMAFTLLGQSAPYFLAYRTTFSGGEAEIVRSYLNVP